MASVKIFILTACVALACASDAEDVEQKKRGAGKATALNAIPTGGQKQDYTYSIYSQSPQATQGPVYQNVQSQIPNSFYPTQSGSSQYYQPAGPQDSGYPPQPQLNLLPPASSSQFLPYNYVPNAYQTGRQYQIVPSKGQNGNLQLLLQPQSQFSYQSPQFAYPHNLFGQQSQISQQGHLLNPISQGQFAPNYQLPQLGQQYVGQPSTMLLVAQPTPNIYNGGVIYPNQAPNLYNYYQQTPQAKYNLYYGSPQSQSPAPNPNEYEKLQGSVQQSIPKEDNEISVHNSDYLTPSESNSNYKNAYATGPSRSYKN